ncbi:MAG: BlaI/MecI/CopY family transcriptional regulator [Lachnospiraceae bacterium]|nr:BlaI/MecI/CopY family transcriptional regulator [Lachnospiraceae bacterium]
MKPLPQISEAEYEVMRIIWKYAPISTNEIVEKLAAVTSWNPKTIQTLIKRLVIKHAITYEKESRMFVYSPLVEEREYISQESNTFLKKYYDGNIATMLSAYLDNEKLSESEIGDLRKLLEKKS